MLITDRQGTTPVLLRVAHAYRHCGSIEANLHQLPGKVLRHRPEAPIPVRIIRRAERNIATTHAASLHY